MNNRPTQEQKEIVLDIPSFLNQPEMDIQEMEQAILNNVPGVPNPSLENAKDLKEFERMCKNWPREYKEIAAHTLDSQVMIAELGNRLRVQEMFINNNKTNLETLVEKLS